MLLDEWKDVWDVRRAADGRINSVIRRRTRKLVTQDINEIVDQVAGPLKEHFEPLQFKHDQLTKQIVALNNAVNTGKKLSAKDTEALADVIVAGIRAATAPIRAKVAALDTGKGIGHTDTEALADVIVEAIKAAIKPYERKIAALETRNAALETRIAEHEARPTLKDAGDWTHGQLYDVGATVRHRGSIWVCKDAHFSVGEDLDHEKFKLWLKRSNQR